METTPTIYRSLAVIARPVALAVAVLAFLIAAGFGAGALSTERASAQPALTITGACTPDSVRPGEPALLTCVVDITNVGTETATNLMGNLGPVSGCSIPSPLPIFIDLTRNGELVSTDPLPLLFGIGDLAPGATVETVSRLVVSDFGTGVVGGQVSVFSDDVAVSVSVETCWTVSTDAAAPPTNLQVTKTLLSELIFPEPVPVPPPPPPNGDVVVALPPVVAPVPVPMPPGLEKAEFEIVVTNVSAGDMTGVTILDVQTGGAVLVSAEPPPSGTDATGRPTWDADTLAPGGEFRIVVSVGPPPDGNCAYADDVVVVSATPAGGEAEDYVALADFGVNVGPCLFIQPDYCEHFPPGDGFPVFASCDEKVWWGAPPDGGEYRPVFNPTSGEEYCWFVPPTTGSSLHGEGPVLHPCSEPVCWISFGPAEEDFVGQIPCDFQFCEYAAPDGLQTIQEGCDFPVCWSMPPGGGDWQIVFGCGEFEAWCWFSSPSQESSFLELCQFDLCFSTPPPGVLDGGEPLHVSCDEGVDLCWPLPPDGQAEFTYPVPCTEVDNICWVMQPGDQGAIQFPCDAEFCLEPPPGDVTVDPPPPDLSPPSTDGGSTEPGIPSPCPPDGGGATVVSGTSVPAVIEQAVSTPAELVEGTSAKIEPMPSSAVLPAQLVPSERVELAPDGCCFIENDSGDNLLASPEALGAPATGAGPAGEGGSARLWALALGLAAAGLVFAGGAWRLRRRYR